MLLLLLLFGDYTWQVAASCLLKNHWYQWLKFDKIIDDNGWIVKILKKTLATMVSSQKPLTIPSSQKNYHRYGLIQRHHGRLGEWVSLKCYINLHELCRWVTFGWVVILYQQSWVAIVTLYLGWVKKQTLLRGHCVITSWDFARLPWGTSTNCTWY